LAGETSFVNRVITYVTCFTGPSFVATGAKRVDKVSARFADRILFEVVKDAALLGKGIYSKNDGESCEKR
jgi:hypothetical protein